MSETVATSVERLSDRMVIDHALGVLYVDDIQVPVTATGGQTVVSTSDVAKSVSSWAGAGALILGALQFIAMYPDQVLPYLHMVPPSIAVPLGSAVFGIAAAYRYWSASRTGQKVIVSPEEKKAAQRASY